MGGLDLWRQLLGSDQPHFVAIYTIEGEAWQELARAELPNDDYLDPGSVAQATVEPSLDLAGGSGRGGRALGLLRPAALRRPAAAWRGVVVQLSTSGGWLHDLNNDGVPEVVLDATDPYIFCYACGVRLVNYSVLRWDGERMVKLELTPLTKSISSELLRLNNLAVEQARHGLWKDAEATLMESMPLSVQDPAFDWNAALIRLVAEARAEQARSGIYPLLEHLFYGDYAAVLDVMRAYPPEQLFSPDTPLVKGTVAEGYEPNPTAIITQTTDLALEFKPDLAAAYFLRGWAVQLVDPGNPSVLADIERAAQLAPNEALFTDSLAYLKR